MSASRRGGRSDRVPTRAIVEAAAKLTIKGGCAFTTILRIAQHADAATDGLHVFPNKDDILFGRIDEQIMRAHRHLQSGDGEVIERLEAWFNEDREYQQLDRDTSWLRFRAIIDDPRTAARDRRHFGYLPEAIAAQSTVRRFSPPRPRPHHPDGRAVAGDRVASQKLS